MDDFLHTTLPVIDKRVHRLGLACNYGIDAAGIEEAVDRGVNYLFWTPFQRKATPAIKRLMKERRDDIVLATGPTPGWFGGNFRRFTERTLRDLGVEQLDVLQLFWLGVSSALTEGTLETLLKLREEGKIKAIGTSIHDRKRAGALAADSELDLLMVRYNAAHPGAERDIFPHLPPGRRAVVAYTATRWRKLLKRPRGWEGRVPTAGDCYRFCLSDPHVNVVLTGPASREQFAENLDALDKGPLTAEEDSWMRAFGEVVHG